MPRDVIIDIQVRCETDDDARAIATALESESLYRFVVNAGRHRMAHTPNDDKPKKDKPQERPPEVKRPAPDRRDRKDLERKRVIK